MHRRNVIEYDEEGKPVKKNYLTYMADYHCKNWNGVDYWIRDHEHGVFENTKFTAQISPPNPETGRSTTTEVRSGSEKVYYIELTDKNRVDTINQILNSAPATIVENIQWYGHFPDSIYAMGRRDNTFSQEQFINSSYEEMLNLSNRPRRTSRHRWTLFPKR